MLIKSDEEGNFPLFGSGAKQKVSFYQRPYFIIMALVALPGFEPGSDG